MQIKSFYTRKQNILAPNYLNFQDFFVSTIGGRGVEPQTS